MLLLLKIWSQGKGSTCLVPLPLPAGLLLCGTLLLVPGCGSAAARQLLCHTTGGAVGVQGRPRDQVALPNQFHSADPDHHPPGRDAAERPQETSKVTETQLVMVKGELTPKTSLCSNTIVHHVCVGIFAAI